MLWGAMVLGRLAAICSLKRPVKTGIWTFSREPECGVVETTITCTGSGTLTADIVRESGAYATYTSAVLQDGITTIAKQAFRDCINLKSVTLPSTLKTVEAEAFADCALPEITIPSSVTDWDSGAALNCTKLTTYKLSGSGSSYSVLNGMLKKGSVIVNVGCGLNDGRSLSIPSGNSITELGEHCCRYCRMTSVTVPSGVTKISNCVFYGCPKLTSLSLPSSLTSFSGRALEGCVTVTSITGLGNNRLYTENGMMGELDGTTKT